MKRRLALIEAHPISLLLTKSNLLNRSMMLQQACWVLFNLDFDIVDAINITGTVLSVTSMTVTPAQNLILTDITADDFNDLLKVIVKINFEVGRRCECIYLSIKSTCDVLKLYKIKLNKVSCLSFV